MCNAAAGARAPVHARDEVIGLLRHDFGRVLDEFREFQQLDRDEAAHAGQRIVQRAFAELKVIAAVEEELLYPAVRHALKDTDLIDQSQIEHACIRRLINELEEAEPAQPDYPRDFRILGGLPRRRLPGLRAPRSVFFGLNLEGIELCGADLSGCDLRATLTRFQLQRRR